MYENSNVKINHDSERRCLRCQCVLSRLHWYVHANRHSKVWRVETKCNRCGQETGSLQGACKIWSPQNYDLCMYMYLQLKRINLVIRRTRPSNAAQQRHPTGEYLPHPTGAAPPATAASAPCRRARTPWRTCRPQFQDPAGKSARSGVATWGTSQSARVLPTIFCAALSLAFSVESLFSGGKGTSGLAKKITAKWATR